jgi:outer membrane protein TolC
MSMRPLLFMLALTVAGGAEPPLQVGALVEEALHHNSEVAASRGQTERADRLKVTALVKQAYYRLRHAYATRDYIQRDRDLLRDLSRIAEANYASGKALQQDVLKAQVQISLLEPQVVEAEHDMQSREAEIDRLLGRDPDSPLGRPPDEKPPALGFSLEQLQAKAGKAADGVRLPRYEIRDSYLAAQHAATMMDIYDRTILPQSRFAAHSSLVSYENGTSDFLNVLADYTTVFEAERNYNNQVENFSLALVRLEELTGVELIH